MHAHTTTRLAYSLPRGSEVLVSLDQNVKEGEVLAKTFVSKETVSFPLATILHADPKKIPWLLVKKTGDDIRKGDLVAFKKGFLGLFSKKFHASVDGKIDNLNTETGDLFINLDPEEVPFISDVTGKVVEVSPDLVSVEFLAVEFDAHSSYKGKKVGRIEVIKVPHDKDALSYLDIKVEGKIVAVDGEVGRDFLYKASALGSIAVIVSMDHKDLADSEVFDKRIKVLSKEVVISMPVFMVDGENWNIKTSIWEALEANNDHTVILDGDCQKILLPKG